MTFLALAGLADTSAEQWDVIGWLFLFLATFLPVCPIRLVFDPSTWNDLSEICLAVAQLAVIILMLRVTFSFFRRRGCGLEGASWLMGLTYFPICFGTNALWWLTVWR